MLQFALWRIAGLWWTLFAASLVIFIVIEVLPGDPAQVMLGMSGDAQSLGALREQLGLNAPVAQRYLTWATGMLHGDFGVSYTYSVPVADLLRERLTVSLPLAAIALALATVLGLPLGVLAARFRGRLSEAGLMAGLQVGVALPNFWLALLLIYVFSISLRWLPAGGFAGWEKGLWAGLSSLLLPAVALALPQAAILARIMRSALLDVMHEDYIRTARAKGLSRQATLWRHGVRNAMIPVLTVLGLQFSFLIAGAVIIESVFYLPGLGRLVFQAISQRDLITVKSTVMLLVTATVLVAFFVDLAYAAIDPRLRKAPR
ncbi:ABC transporter permease [Polycladidibacter hongkongensis]|uniref:ABC transporter permease n=1 Tax=Polycladidibacter hongkongensis TaxID=1647556 RepID=UPI00082F6862|nr:ABC transporter permease [Pseudovibrio hongkongensis]